MHFSKVLAAVAAFASTVVAVPATNYVLHESRDAAQVLNPHAKRSKVISHAGLPVRIGLTQRSLEDGYDMLMDVSHPTSPNYGKHWTAEQVNKAFAPTAETVQAVRDWLLASGIASERITVSDNKGWLALDTTVAEAESLFRTQFYEEELEDVNKYSIGCDKYYLPAHLQEHIDYITPGVKHSVFKRNVDVSMKKRSIRSANVIAPPPLSPPAGIPASIEAKSIPVNCSQYVINSDCIRALYNLPAQNLNRKVATSNRLGIYESGESYSKKDLKQFFEELEPEIPSNTIPEYSSVDGGEGPVSQAESGGEAMLDITIAYALIYPQQINFFSVDDHYSAYHDYGFMDTFLDAIDGSFCTYSAFGQTGNNDTIDPVYPDPHAGGYKGPLMCGEYKPPTVFSVSYSEGTNYLPVNYVKRQCNEWMKLGLQGTSVLISSGDYGVSTRPHTYGVTNGCQGANDTVFTPSWFNECPYVTSVGATQIKLDTSGYSANPEEAVYINLGGVAPFTSGSGFSNIFPRPEYQNAAVKEFFKTADPGYPYYSTTNGKNIGANGGLYNRNGRAYPDVSANGAWWYDVVNGTVGRTGGTSMSTPLFASIISILNDDRIAAGKSTLGFLNPTFYAYPTAFNDITYGANQGCGIRYAFNATAGWDPPTGLGTPKHNMLKKIFMSMP